LSDTIKEEIRELRKELAQTPLLTNSSHIDGSELTADYGTMANYLESIWESGSFTTDQDIWECFYDIVSVYVKDDVPVSLRNKAVTAYGFGTEFLKEKYIWGILKLLLSLLVEHLSDYTREPYVKGTRRCRWKLRVNFPHRTN